MSTEVHPGPVTIGKGIHFVPHRDLEDLPGSFREAARLIETNAVEVTADFWGKHPIVLEALRQVGVEYGPTLHPYWLNWLVDEMLTSQWTFRRRFLRINAQDGSELAQKDATQAVRWQLMSWWLPCRMTRRATIKMLNRIAGRIDAGEDSLVGIASSTNNKALLNSIRAIAPRLDDQ